MALTIELYGNIPARLSSADPVPFCIALTGNYIGTGKTIKSLRIFAESPVFVSGWKLIARKDYSSPYPTTAAISVPKLLPGIIPPAWQKMTICEMLGIEAPAPGSYYDLILTSIYGLVVLSPSGDDRTPSVIGTKIIEVYTPGAPTCSFKVSQSVGYVPFYVEFADTSTTPADAPITSWLWDFGDGTSSRLQNPVHTYESPGTFTVKLTVTNKYGPDSATRTLEAIAGDPHPVFSSKCYFPFQVKATEVFTPKLLLDNQGGPGSVYVDMTIAGVTKRILETDIEGYITDYDCNLGAHAVSWYLGYEPTAPMYFSPAFTAGIVGKPPTSTYSPTPIAVIVEAGPICTEGDFKCVGSDRYICQSGAWVLYEENSATCGYGPSNWGWLPYAGLAGIAAVGLGIYFFVRGRTRRRK
jgi:PKD repeat protein